MSKPNELSWLIEAIGTAPPRQPLYENFLDCLRLLNAAGMGKPGKSNCLVNMVEEAIGEIQRLRKLIGQAVTTPPFKHGLPNWSKVGAVFGLGSTSAAKLCEEFGINPDKVEYECPQCGMRLSTNDFCSDRCRKSFEHEEEADDD